MTNTQRIERAERIAADLAAGSRAHDAALDRLLADLGEPEPGDDDEDAGDRWDGLA